MGASRLGLLGDVHAEHRALEGALAVFARDRVEVVLCVGDVVDGAGDVGACVERLAAAGVHAVRGNHERWLLAGAMRELPDATPVGSLEAPVLDWLAALPATREVSTSAGELLLCHGMGDDDMHGVKPCDEGYALECHDALQAVLRARRHAFVVAGHTHARMLRTLGGVVLLNPGTLHRAFGASAAVLDLGRGIATFYDLDTDGRPTRSEHRPFP